MNRIDQKYRIVQIIMVMAGIVLLGQTAYIQLLNERYRQKATTTTMKSKVVYPSRGLIFDRNGRALVVNTPRYELQATYNQVSPTMDTAKFCQLLQITKPEFKSLMKKDWKSPQYSKSIPFSFVKNISAGSYAKIQEHLHEFPGFTVIQRNVREYPHMSASHVLGYISEIDQNTLVDSSENYALGDYIGVSGLEKYYETELRGEKGVDFILVDNLGRPLESFNQGELDVPAKSGKNIITSLDLELQAYAEKLLSTVIGGIVAIEPSSGEILSMVSAPNYDPSVMSADRHRVEVLEELLQDTLKPFFDRSIMAKYPPASIFKPVMALIALQEGVIHPYTSIFCPSYYQYESFTYGCHHHPYTSNIKVAIEHSCNSYFFQTFRNTIEQYGYKNHDKGLDVMIDYLNDFGLGRKLGVDIPGESPGFIPTSRFYDDLYPANDWKSTYIMSIGIGQGELQLTTLQMANLAAIIANKGYYYTPHFIKGFMDAESSLPQSYNRPNTVNIDTSHYNPIIEGMERAVRSGTAYKGYLPEAHICGKTGTSQNPQGDDHSVFFAFAPRENPKIALSVYVENAGFGGDVAAIIASLMIEKYLFGEVKRKRLEEQILNLNLRYKNQS